MCRLEYELGQGQAGVDIVAVQTDIDDAAAVNLGRKPVDRLGLALIVDDVLVFQRQLLQQRPPRRQEHARPPLQPAQYAFQPDALGGFQLLRAVVQDVFDRAAERQERRLDARQCLRGQLGGDTDAFQARMRFAFTTLSVCRR